MSGFYDPNVYDATEEGVPGDVEFYTALATDAHAGGHPVLELACGTGRVAIPVAREGVQLVGLDLSPEMLALAREKSEGMSSVRWVEGDMRSFDLQERFGLIFIPFRSFLHLLTTKDQLACLRCIRTHLVPGGRLALNVFNPDIVKIGRWLSSNPGVVRRRGGGESERGAGATKRWESREYSPANQEVQATFIDEELDGDGAVTSRVYRDLKLRYVFRFEMEHLLALAGFEVEALYGDCFGGAFEDTSPEMVWVARRPD